MDVSIGMSMTKCTHWFWGPELSFIQQTAPADPKSYFKFNIGHPYIQILLEFLKAAGILLADRECASPTPWLPSATKALKIRYALIKAYLVQLEGLESPNLPRTSASDHFDIPQWGVIVIGNEKVWGNILHLGTIQRRCVHRWHSGRTNKADQMFKDFHTLAV